MIGWFSGLYCKVRTAWLRGMLSSSIQFLRDVINILQPRSFPRSASLCYGTLFFPLQFIAINWSGNKHGPKLTAGPSNSVSKRHVLSSWARPLLDELQLKKNGTTPATQLRVWLAFQVTWKRERKTKNYLSAAAPKISAGSLKIWSLLLRNTPFPTAFTAGTLGLEGLEFGNSAVISW